MRATILRATARSPTGAREKGAGLASANCYQELASFAHSTPSAPPAWAKRTKTRGAVKCAIAGRRRAGRRNRLALDLRHRLRARPHRRTGKKANIRFPAHCSCGRAFAGRSSQDRRQIPSGSGERAGALLEACSSRSRRATCACPHRQRR